MMLTQTFPKRVLLSSQLFFIQKTIKPYMMFFLENKTVEHCFAQINNININKRKMSTYSATSKSKFTIELDKTTINLKKPKEPTNIECCGTGCYNCVWMDYFGELQEYERQLKKIKKQKS